MSLIKFCIVFTNNHTLTYVLFIDMYVSVQPSASFSVSSVLIYGYLYACLTVNDLMGGIRQQIENDDKVNRNWNDKHIERTASTQTFSATVNTFF